MEPTQLLLAQTLALSGLVGAVGAYAGILRRRANGRLEAAAISVANEAAIERVERHMTLARLEHTFVKSAYRPRNRRFPIGR